MAYEDMTYENILNRMLDRIKASNSNIDTREGSMLFNAVAPEAMELAIAYSQLANFRDETFILTASRNGKIERCKEIGIDTSIFDATYGTFKGVFNLQIELGSRWNLDLYNYTATSYIGMNSDGRYEYVMTCETLGTEPNSMFGTLTPIMNELQGLTYSELTEVLIEGENEVSDEGINEYYLNKVNGAATDGNVFQYKKWCEDFNGIGNYKVFPLWNGDNTVKVSVLSASNQVATDELVSEFQKFLDPCTIDKFTGDGSTTVFTLSSIPPVIDMVMVNGAVKEETNDYSYAGGTVTFVTAPDDAAKIEVRYNGGMGDGKAPIGAFVTVSTATEKKITVTGDIYLKAGYSETTLINEAIEDYLSSVAYENSKIAYMAIGSVIINCPCVDFVSNLKINGSTDDLTVGEEEIITLGTATWTVVE